MPRRTDTVHSRPGRGRKFPARAVATGHGESVPHNTGELEQPASVILPQHWGPAEGRGEFKPSAITAKALCSGVRPTWPTLMPSHRTGQPKKENKHGAKAWRRWHAGKKIINIHKAFGVKYIKGLVQKDSKTAFLHNYTKSAGFQWHASRPCRIRAAV